MRHRPDRHGLARCWAILAVGALAAAGCASNNEPKRQNSLDPQGKVARDIMALFTPFFWVAVVIGLGVIGVTVYMAIRFRHRPGNENPRQTHGNTVLEISWTLIPALILVIMAVFTVQMIWNQAGHPKGSLEVTVTGKQWWWEFEYTNYDGGRRVFTANELHIPTGRDVYFSIKSDNANHSFWIPNLAGKKDAVPGHVNHFWLRADKHLASPGKGTWFYGQCTEYCGLSHADMRLKAYVETSQDFSTWYQSELAPWSADEVKTFKDLANTKWGCTSCHYIKGFDARIDKEAESGSRDQQDSSAGGPIAVGPNLTHLADRTTFASAKYDLTFDNLWQWVYDAPAHYAGEFGKPNECPRRGPNGDVDWKTSPCKVGMPSFENDPDYAMTQQQAQAIARFLMSTKASTSDGSNR